MRGISQTTEQSFPYTIFALYNFASHLTHRAFNFNVFMTKLLKPNQAINNTTTILRLWFSYFNATFIITYYAHIS